MNAGQGLIIVWLLVGVLTSMSLIRQDISQIARQCTVQAEAP